MPKMICGLVNECPHKIVCPHGSEHDEKNYCHGPCHLKGMRGAKCVEVALPQQEKERICEDGLQISFNTCYKHGTKKMVILEDGKEACYQCLADKLEKKTLEAEAAGKIASTISTSVIMDEYGRCTKHHDQFLAMVQPQPGLDCVKVCPQCLADELRMAKTEMGAADEILKTMKQRLLMIINNS